MKATGAFGTKLSWSLAGATLVFAALVALLIACIDLWIADRADLKAIEQHFEQIEKSSVAAITEALWQYDTSVLTLIANGILKQDYISSLAVHEAGKEKALISLGAVPVGAIVHEYPLQRYSMAIGRLVVAIDREAIRAFTLGRFGTSLFAALILTLCVAGFVMLLIERRVMRFLRQTAKFVIGRNSSNLSETLTLPRRKYLRGDDEIDLLVAGYGRMQQELIRSIDDLQRDIRRREVVEKSLHKSEIRFRQMFENNITVLLLIDPGTGAIVDANAAAANFYGYPADCLRSMHIGEINALPPDQAAAARSLALEQRQNRFVFPHRLASGEIRTVEVSYTPIQVNERILIFAIVNDITDRQRAQDALTNSESRLSAIFNGSPIGIVVAAAADGRILEINEVALETIGYGRDEAIGHTTTDLHLFVNPAQRQEGLRQLREHGRIVRWRIDFRKRNGALGVVEVSSSPIQIDGEQCLINMWVDVTERHRAEDQVRKLSQAVEQSPANIVITNTAAEIEYVNSAFLQTTGYSLEEVLGQNPRILQSGKTPAETYSSLWDELSHGRSWKGEMHNRRKDGSQYVELAVIAPMRQPDGAITHYVAVKEDITARKQAEERINTLAFYDPLTELPNRRLLNDRLQQALAASARHQTQGALLMVDLDNFKDINDVLGHEQGDLALQQAARRLSACIGEGDTLARLGADEFVVLLAQLDHSPLEAAMQAEIVGNKILDALRQPYRLDGSEMSCTASIGIALFGEQQQDAAEPLKRAELAMYQSKAQGRNTLRFFDPRMQAVVASRVAMEASLRDAVGKDQLLLHYQPQVTDRGQITAAEALLRWLDPKRGMVSPAEFIPLAEETGLILPIGNWVLETACKQLALWAGQSGMADLTVAVNVSARQFHQRDFVDQVLMTLQRTGASPHRLKLELTESVLVEEVEGVIAKMTALKGRGVTFSLDDFGTGYSSLSYLQRLPLDQLKIDQGFVRNILVNANDAAIARMVVALADSLGLTVIPEGVETEAQRDFLAGLGCHDFQGYLFSRPLPVQEFEAFVRRG